MIFFGKFVRLLNCKRYIDIYDFVSERNFSKRMSAIVLEFFISWQVIYVSWRLKFVECCFPKSFLIKISLKEIRNFVWHGMNNKLISLLTLINLSCLFESTSLGIHLCRSSTWNIYGVDIWVNENWHFWFEWRNILSWTLFINGVTEKLNFLIIHLIWHCCRFLLSDSSMSFMTQLWKNSHSIRITIFSISPKCFHGKLCFI